MKIKNAIRTLALLVLGATSALAQTPVTILNPSFESPVLSPGGFLANNITNWTIGSGGAQGTFAGVQYPTSSVFTSIPDGHQTMYTGVPTVTQNLGVTATANGTYVLTVPVGHRLDGIGNGAVANIQLLAGTTSLCNLSVNNNSITAGTFAVQTLTCPTGTTVPSGNLVVSLGSNGIQSSFDNISLTFTANIAVSVSPTTASVNTGSMTLFTGTVTGDSANAGVTWTATRGSVSPTSSASGAQVTYTAPSTSGTDTVTATSVTDPTKSASSAITVNFQHSVALGWQDTINPSGTVTYNVLRATAPCSGYTVLTSGITNMMYTDFTISPSLTYCYEIQAVRTSDGSTSGFPLAVTVNVQ